MNRVNAVIDDFDESRLEEYPEADWEIDRVRSFFTFRLKGDPGGFD